MSKGTDKILRVLPGVSPWTKITRKGIRRTRFQRGLESTQDLDEETGVDEPNHDDGRTS